MSTTDSRLPIAIVGLNFGRHILKLITEEDGAPWLRLAAICDVDQSRADAVAAQYQVPAYYDLQPLLDDPAIPAIGLYTGPVGRADLIRRIIRAGKDVLTTKPFERDPDAALDVLREAKKLGRVVHLNSPAPVLPPDVATIQQWREQYNLGAPIGVRADVWAPYREKPDGTWYDDPQKCPVAPIFRLGIYLLNDLIQIFGEVSDLQLMQTRLFTGRPTVDNAQLSLRFASGALGNIFGSFCVNDGDHYRNTMTLNFENGTIHRNTGPDRPTGGTELALVQRRNEVRAIVARIITTGESGSYQWENFVKAVRGEKLPNETTPEQIVAGLRVIARMTELANQ